MSTITRSLPRPAPARRPVPERAAALNRVPYLPGLDGLRAIAVVAVMIYHANHEWLGGGFLGVEVFFVISGYLITLLLIGEHERYGAIDLREFWMRRARRLLPALFVMLAGLATYMALSRQRAQGRTRGDFLGGIFYVSNWYQIFVGQGYTSSGAFAPLRHLWSLAVEEQFYLLWPLIMVLILRRGRGRDHLPRVGLWLGGIGVAIAALTAAVFASGDVPTTCSPENMHGYWQLFGRCISINDTLYLSTITRAGGLMLGAGFAMLWRPMAITRGPLRDKGRTLDLAAVVGVALLGLLMWKITLTGDGRQFGTRFDPWLFRGGLLWTGLATLLAIAAVTHRGARAGRVIGSPMLRWIGTRSYGLYLFHWPIYQIIRKYAGVGLTGGQFVLAMVITVPITELSYRLVETPIRRGGLSAWWRARDVRPTHVAAGPRRPVMALGVVALAVVGFSAVSIGVATNRCVGDVECTLAGAGPEPTLSPPATAGGESAPPTPATEVGGAPVTTADRSATSPATTSPATTAGPPPERLALGESVMFGAKKPLEAGGFVVDAQESRSAVGTIADIRRRRDAGQIGPVVVLQVGTNNGVSDDELRQMVELMPSSQIYFLTVKAPKPWIEPSNNRIFALAQKYPNVHIIDWNGRAAEVADQLSKSDGGIHLSTFRARQFYANMIFDSIGHSELDQPLPNS